MPVACRQVQEFGARIRRVIAGQFDLTVLTPPRQPYFFFKWQKNPPITPQLRIARLISLQICR
jgi:hypothetical protein